MAGMSDVEEVSSEKKPRSGLAQGAAYVLLLVGPFIMNGMLVLFGSLSYEFAADPSDVMIAIPAFMVPFAILQLFSGAISDVAGRAPVVFGGVTLSSLGLAISATSTSVSTYAGAHIIMGIGWGFINPAAIALITDLTPPRSVPTKMGIIGAVGSIGVALGPFAASMILIQSWRWFYASLFFVTLLVLPAIAFSRKAATVGAAGSGVRVFLSYVSQELRRPVVLLLMLMGFMFAMTYLATVVWTSRALTGVISDTLIGNLLMISGLVAAVVGVLAGWLTKRKGVRLPLILGITTLILSAIVLASIDDLGNPISLPRVTSALLMVAVAAGTLYPISIYYSQMLAPGKRGALAGLLMSAQFIGNALIPALFEPFYELGVKVLFEAILVASILYLIVSSALYRRAPLKSQTTT
jgi:MFS family permease